MKNLTSRFLKNIKGQGATEYILILVIVVGLAIMLKEPITKMIEGKMSEIEGSVSGFGVN